MRVWEELVGAFQAKELHGEKMSRIEGLVGAPWEEMRVVGVEDWSL